ncbi:outer membrane protein [Pseudorhodoplanes sinuspersici]|uniref:Outer membrane protein beta-barrel domain-containing protein n=1 Tax=Pseudorhodoplanes sinuspersici TaxID=1235591 RepID=A0A1W7A0L0_9HYPH|nr:outer membrane beta-barrel protein [Pseudorhodoplanes sinuspersici]ARQ03118.1 hypothetical protein CAK95_22185 [Pseudorhodoplanes sinuspersici]
MWQTRLGITALIGYALCMPVSAADLRPAYKAPPPAPVIYNWTGFYIGGFAGGAWGGDANSTDLDGYNVAGSSWSHGLDSSFIGGGTIGWNWQAVGSPWVWGIEGEFGYIKLDGLAADPLSPALDTLSSARVGEWYGFAGGRLGYAWDRVMLYAKGGAAFVNLNRATFDNCSTGGCGGGLINATNNETLTTWAVGGGIEWAWLNNWSVKIEYLFIDLKDADVCGTSGGATFCWRHELDSVHTLKAGLNYKFDWGKTPVSPVVARY